MFSGTEPRIILNPGNFTLPDVRTYRIRGFLIAEGELNLLNRYIET